MKSNTKDLQFKHQDMFPFEKYVNCLKKCYNKLSNLGNPKFESQKGHNMLDHINCTYDQVKACIHTARKDHKDEFSGACTYLERNVA